MPQNEDPLQFTCRKLLTTFAEGLRKVRGSQHVNYRSRTMCRHVLKSLDLKPYRVTADQQVQEADVVKRVNCCMWLLNSMSSHSRIKNRFLVCCVRDAHNWTDIYWQDSQHGSLHEHFWRILCSTNRRWKTQLFLPAGRVDMSHFSGVPAGSSWRLLWGTNG